MPPMVFHVQRFLERPEVLVLSTASRGLNAVTARTPDPLLRDLFAAQRQVAAQPAHPDELLDEATAQDLLSITRELFARRGEPAAPPAFRQRPLAAALMAIGREKIERTQAIRTREAHASNRELCDRWIRAAASDAQAQLTAKPWEGDVIHEAARILCGLGRTREAEQVLRWRLLWRPDDASARRQLVDVLLQARRYDAAIEAMMARNQICAEADRNAWVSQYEEDGSTARADSILWANTKAPIAQALLLQGHTGGAFHQIDKGVAADPFTLAVIEHSRGRVAETQAAFARIADPFSRALFHAWQGNAQVACQCLIAEFERADESAFRPLLDVLHSPFLEPIRQSPQWQGFLSHSSLAPEQLDRIPFDISPVDPERTRQAAELWIRKHAEAAERDFANSPAKNALLLAIELNYLARFESAEQVLRWEIARFPRDSLTQRWLGEVLMRAGRTDEALVQADIADEMGWTSYRDVRKGHLLLSGQAQAAYDQERNAEHPDPGMMAMAAHTLGLFDERDRLIGQLDNSSTAMATTHAWAGQVDEAFEWLHPAAARGSYSYEILRYVVHSPFIEPIRRDPRWPVFLRSVNMAPDQLAAIPLRFELPPLPLKTTRRQRVTARRRA
jgi:predicted negative regulator of RcsB-dependent stress response